SGHGYAKTSLASECPHKTRREADHRGRGRDPGFAQLGAGPPRRPQPCVRCGPGAEESGKGPKSRVLALLPVDDALHVDEIVNLLENALSAPEVLALLFDLELEGRIRQIP